MTKIDEIWTKFVSNFNFQREESPGAYQGISGCVGVCGREWVDRWSPLCRIKWAARINRPLDRCIKRLSRTDHVKPFKLRNTKSLCSKRKKNQNVCFVLCARRIRFYRLIQTYLKSSKGRGVPCTSPDNWIRHIRHNHVTSFLKT